MASTAARSGVAQAPAPGTTAPVATPRVNKFTPKITAPSVRADMVPRARLIDQLLDLDATEVLITAPAGYGKSTLAALWATSDPRPFGWVAVDRFDNDPVVFLTYLALALDSIQPLDEGLHQQLFSSHIPWAEMLPAVVDAVANMPVPYVLVVDDAHRLTGQSATVALAALGSRVPQGSTLAVISRGPMPYPTSRAVLAGRSRRLTIHDLTMDADETAHLVGAAGLETDHELVASLHDKTEGWPAGLYIAALALRGDSGARSSIEEFTGGDRLVTEYMTEEVLDAMGAEEVQFLLATSVLTRLSGDLCDDALGGSGSGAMLEQLARDNQFVIPLDHAGEWYRYHHLFAEMLLTEARARDSARIHEVARRASAWFERRGEPEAAVEQALAAQEPDRAAALIWRYSPRMLAVNRAGTVAVWLGQFDEGEVARRAPLALTAAWERLTVGDAPAVHRYTKALELQTDEILPDGSPVSGGLAILHGLTRRDGLTAMRDNGARAFAELAPDSPYRIIACFIEGSAAAYLGDLERARERLTEGIRLGAGVLPAVHAQCLTKLSRVELTDDNPVAADRLSDEAMRIVAATDIGDRPVTCLCYSRAAVMYLRRGDTALADEARTRALDLVEKAEDLSPYHILACRLDLAMAAVMARDLDVARTLLDEAERRLARLPETGTLDATAATIRSSLDAASAPEYQLIEPLTPAELRVLAYLPTHLSFGEIGEELFVSRNTVKSHAMAVYRKLGVTSRSAAVAEATRIGILPT